MSVDEEFEEWFAVKVNDEEFWPGRLNFNPITGMELEVANFSNFEPEGFFHAKHSNNTLFEGSVIKGYLDYQRPTTLLKPFISKIYSGQIGYMTPVIRNRYRITVNGILKNIHLDNIDDEIFLSVGGTSKALHSWISPKPIKRKYESKTQTTTIQYNEYNKFELGLSNDCSLSITNLISGPSNWDSLSLEGQSSFTLRFSKPTALYSALDAYDKLQNFLTFLIGNRLHRNSISLSTTKTVKWNDEDKSIHAELLVSSNRKFSDSHEHPACRFLTQHDTEMSLQDVFSNWQNIDKDTFYFMALITSVEMRDKGTDIINKYTDLLGCLEKFDKKKFGGKKNLLPRLERLLVLYQKDGFRGNPDLKKIKKYRNYQPHGDGASLTIDIIQEMYWYSHFLCALGRYLILKELGFSIDNISKAFRRKSNMYGAFSINENL